jgi:hypothetical protein
MIHSAQRRIMQLGTGWYWELVTSAREVLARGISNTHAEACADADKASAALQAPTIQARFAMDRAFGVQD